MQKTKTQAATLRVKGQHSKDFQTNLTFLLMMLPGLVVLFFNNYLPMGGVVMAFQQINLSKFAFFGKWVGLKNIAAFFQSTYAPLLLRNTVLYNALFISLKVVTALTFAIALNELRSHRLRKLYQTIIFLPYFMSWVVVAGIASGFLNTNNGLFNTQLLPALGLDPIKWYAKPQYWPWILTFVNIWKGVGYGSVMYLASINNIDQNLYEAAAIDGASKWQQILNVTLPMLKPTVITLVLLDIGKIFNTDIGLFYTVPQLNSNGMLTKAVSTLDTYVYATINGTGMGGTSLNFAAAAALFQSMVGFVLVLLTNWLTKKVDKDYGLF